MLNYVCEFTQNAFVSFAKISEVTIPSNVKLDKRVLYLCDFGWIQKHETMPRKIKILISHLSVTYFNLTLPNLFFSKRGKDDPGGLSLDI